MEILSWHLIITRISNTQSFGSLGCELHKCLTKCQTKEIIMRNEALETSGYSQFFIQTASNFLNASDLIMQNLCALITQISSFISSTYNDINLYKDNFKLNDIIQYTCHYSTVECLKSSIKICLSNIELLNTEINYNKRKKKSNQDEFDFTPMDSALNLNDCVYDILISIQNDYYDEKYKKNT